MGDFFFSPASVTISVGDTVTWRNGDASSHTVTATDSSFDSGLVAPGATFTRMFSSPGIYKYYCTIHRYMRGEVDVYGLALTAPGYAVPVGLRTALTGLAPPEVGRVFEAIHREHGVRFHFGQSVQRFEGSNRVEAVVTDRGVRIGCDFACSSVTPSSKLRNAGPCHASPPKARLS